MAISQTAAEEAPARGRSPRLLPARDWELLRAATRGMVAIPAGVEPRLGGAVSTALDNPGSLWRAQLAWAVGRGAGLDAERSLALACAVESFHVASLLLDDLPAMDDAEVRRGAPCVHRLYGEAAAILAALALVQEGHSRMAAALDGSSPAIRAAARALADECLGLRGILDGQARDLDQRARLEPRRDVLRRAAAKSVPLLRLALELPAVAAEVGPQLRLALRRVAESLGLAYQLLDDLADRGAADDRRAVNSSRALGVAATRREVLRLLEAARSASRDVGAQIPEALPVLAAAIGRLAEQLPAPA